ncbi:MAG: UDP-glucose 4-epimerase [Chlamydiae bacterium]|nr:UDP-glucose 4-epimerase [Chlamydiota bacterium]
MAKKTVLVVGGAGFVGSHVNKMLNQADYNTIVLDNLSTGSRQAVTRGKFIEGDMANTELLNEIFTTHSIDAVMHFAAFIDVGESVTNPLKYYQNNVVNTLNLLEAMLRYDVKTFIFSSSAAIFGIPQEKTIRENHPSHPISPYGASKLMVERILRDFDKAYNMKSSCLRYFNAAGGDPEGEIKSYKQKETNLIPIVLRSLRNGTTPITINGSDYPTPDGTCIRDYIHICDLGGAHILAMEQLFNGHPSTQYNLGNGEGFSVQEVIQAVRKVTGIPPKTTVGPRRPGDAPTLLANSEKAHKELHWTPKYPKLETMIQHAWHAFP